MAIGKTVTIGLTAATMLAAAPAHAELVAESEAGFVSRVTVEVKATPAEVWPVMTTPSGWWLDRHTYSGSAANLTLIPSAGGCFCEKLPPAQDKAETRPDAKPLRPGSVEHMRVVYAQPGEALRMVGGLGPLQSEAVSATLTMTIKPAAGGSHITWVYVVGGYTRYKHDEIARQVDAVLTSQLARLAERLGSPARASAGGDQPAGKPEARKAANAAFDKALADKAAGPAAKAPAKPKAKPVTSPPQGH